MMLESKQSAEVGCGTGRRDSKALECACLTLWVMNLAQRDGVFSCYAPLCVQSLSGGALKLSYPPTCPLSTLEVSCAIVTEI